MTRASSHQSLHDDIWRFPYPFRHLRKIEQVLGHRVETDTAHEFGSTSARVILAEDAPEYKWLKGRHLVVDWKTHAIWDADAKPCPWSRR